MKKGCLALIAYGQSIVPFFDDILCKLIITDCFYGSVRIGRLHGKLCPVNSPAWLYAAACIYCRNADQFTGVCHYPCHCDCLRFSAETNGQNILSKLNHKRINGTLRIFEQLYLSILQRCKHPHIFIVQLRCACQLHPAGIDRAYFHYCHSINLHRGRFSAIADGQRIFTCCYVICINGITRHRTARPICIMCGHAKVIVPQLISRLGYNVFP